MRLVSPYFTVFRTIPLVLWSCIGLCGITKSSNCRLFVEIFLINMWESIARLVLRYRLFLLVLLLSVTAFMAFHASKVQLSYDFTRTIPTDNPKYKEYQEFRKRFGDDGNMLFVAVQSDKLFNAEVFADYVGLTEQLKKVPGVDDVLGFSNAVDLIRDSATQKFNAL